jgi:hypothetical protein
MFSHLEPLMAEVGVESLVVRIGHHGCGPRAPCSLSSTYFYLRTHVIPSGSR